MKATEINPELETDTPRPPAWHCRYCGYEGKKERAQKPRPSREFTKICPACLMEAK